MNATKRRRLRLRKIKKEKKKAKAVNFEGNVSWFAANVSSKG